MIRVMREIAFGDSAVCGCAIFIRNSSLTTVLLLMGVVIGVLFYETFRKYDTTLGE